MRNFVGIGLAAALAFYGLFFVALDLSGAAVVGPGGGGLGYTCTDNPGDPKTCTCTGALDCFWMSRSGVCGKDVIVLTCNKDNTSCTCEWKQKSDTPPTNPFQLNDGRFMIIEMN